MRIPHCTLPMVFFNDGDTTEALLASQPFVDMHHMNAAPCWEMVFMDAPEHPATGSTTKVMVLRTQ